jgi:hypothetical protein
VREILVNVRQEASRQKIFFPDWIGDRIDRKKKDKTKSHEYNDMDLSIWKGIFDYDGLRRRRTFSSRIDTDGTKVCFHFREKKKAKNTKQKKKRYTRPRRVVAIDPR